MYAAECRCKRKFQFLIGSLEAVLCREQLVFPSSFQFLIGSLEAALADSKKLSDIGFNSS